MQKDITKEIERHCNYMHYINNKYDIINRKSLAQCDRLGITDKEDINNPDTDDDGYSDGEEVKNRFDPLK